MQQAPAAEQDYLRGDPREREPFPANNKSEPEGEKPKPNNKNEGKCRRLCRPERPEGPEREWAENENQNQNQNGSKRQSQG